MEARNPGHSGARAGVATILALFVGLLGAGAPLVALAAAGGLTLLLARIEPPPGESKISPQNALLVAVLIIALIAAWGVGAGVAGILGWRLFCDARGVRRQIGLSTRTDLEAPEDGPLGAAVQFWLPPVAALAIRLHFAPQSAAGLPFFLPAPSAVLCLALAAAAGVALLLWAVRRLADWRLVSLPVAPTAAQAGFQVVALAALLASPDPAIAAAMLAAYRAALRLPARPHLLRPVSRLLLTPPFSRPA